MLRDAVARFSKEHIAPHVRRMDETATMDASIIKGCFDNGTSDREVGILTFPSAPRNCDTNAFACCGFCVGLMGIETKQEWGGTSTLVSRCLRVHKSTRHQNIENRL